MLYFIGIGLSDEKDITVRGLEAVRECDTAYLETYTSKMQCSTEELEDFYETEIIEADRDLVEQTDEIIETAREEDVAFLVMGDVFSATTHFQIYRTAIEEDIEVEVVHNASVINAVSQTGLQLYKFGRTASIPFENEEVETPYRILENNQEIGLHTLFLLDVEGEDYMSVGEAIDYLLRAESFEEDTLCVGCARLGCDDATIKADTARKLKKEDFGEPPHCLIVPGELHFLEEEALDMWM